MMELFEVTKGFLSTHFYLLVLLGGVIFSMQAQKRDRFALRLALSCLLCLTVGLVNEVIYTALSAKAAGMIWNSALDMGRSLLLYGISTAAIYACYQYSVKNAVYVSAFGYTLQHMTFLIYYLCRYYFQTERNPFADTTLFLVLFAGVYLAEYLLLRGMQDYAVNIENGRMIVQSCIFLFCAVVLSVLSYNYIVSNETLQGTPAVFVVSAFGIVMCINIIIGLLDSFQTRKVKQELAMTRQMWQEDVRQYELTKQTIDVLNFRYHDLKNQMALLVQDKKVAQEIRQCLDSYSDSVRTGNESMDVVLTEKSILCRKYDIDLTCMADAECLMQVSPVDVYSILGNLIDNAVEYLREIPDRDKRLISLSIGQEGAVDVIQIDNFLQQKPEEERGFPVTTKGDKANHGYGLRSVQYMVKKYDGIMRISTDNQLFSVTIVLPLKEQLKAETLQLGGA